jgi:hypothetical protein
MATIGPEEMQYALRHMLHATDPVEQEMLRERVAAPPAAVA